MTTLLTYALQFRNHRLGNEIFSQPKAKIKTCASGKSLRKKFTQLVSIPRSYCTSDWTYKSHVSCPNRGQVTVFRSCWVLHSKLPFVRSKLPTAWSFFRISRRCIGSRCCRTSHPRAFCVANPLWQRYIWWWNRLTCRHRNCCSNIWWKLPVKPTKAGSKAVPKPRGNCSNSTRSSELESAVPWQLKSRWALCGFAAWPVPPAWRSWQVSATVSNPSWSRFAELFSSDCFFSVSFG